MPNKPMLIKYLIRGRERMQGRGRVFEAADCKTIDEVIEIPADKKAIPWILEKYGKRATLEIYQLVYVYNAPNSRPSETP